MKLTYLGTAAAEGMPAVFCNCAYCKEARKLGGKNIRTRSQAMVNDDLLIDFPADTYFHFLTNGIEGDLIKNLLITHPHGDHLYPAEFEMRHSPFAHEMREGTLGVYCGAGAIRKIEQVPNVKHVDVHKISPYQPTVVGEYTVTALPARHMDDPAEEPFIYVICGKDATLLYAHDTGYFYDEVFQYIEKEGIRFDCVSYDCTNVNISYSDKGGHMGISNIGRVHDRLMKMGAIDENTIEVVNHFSHNGNPLQHVVEELVKDYGFLVAYDGMQTEISGKK